MAIATADKIFCDVNDEINFVVEKLLHAEKERVILVVPQNSLVVSSLVSMKILAKQVSKSKKLLIVVSEDDFGLKLAEQAGLVAVNKVSAVTPELWESAQISKHKFLEARQELKQQLLSDRGVIEPEALPEADKSIAPEEVEKQVDAQDEAGEPEVVEDEVVEQDAEQPTAEAEPELDASDAEAEPEEEVADAEQPEAEEEAVGAIQRKRLEPKLNTVGAFQILAGGDIDQWHTDAVDVNISAVMDEDSSSQSKREVAPVAARSFTGRDWTKYVDPNSPGILDRIKKMFAGNQRKLPAEREADAKRRRRLILIVVFVLLIMLSGATYLLAFQLSNVEIRISLKTADVPVEQQITADAALTSVDTQTISIPATVIKESDLSISASATATGDGKTGTKAAGLIEFWNKTDHDIALTKGTVIENTTTNLKYVVQEDITIPKGTPDPDNPDVIKTPGGVKLEVRIEAEKIGAEYNLTESGTGVDFKVASYSTAEIIGKRFRDITGGASQSVIVVSQENFDALHNTLEDKLKEQGINKIKNLVPADSRLIEGSEEFTETEATSSPALGEQATEFSLSLKGEVTALVVSNEDLKQAISLVISKNQELGEEFEVDDLEDVVITSVTREGDKVTFTITSRGSLRSKVTEGVVKQAIQGKSLDEAEQYLANLEEVEGFKLTYSPQIVPAWLQKVPNDPNRIKLIFQ